MGAFQKFVATVVPGVIKPIRVLWNEMVGFVFAVFTVLIGFRVFRAWQVVNTDPDARTTVIFGAIGAVFMGYFAFSSFLRARKIGRQ